MALYKVRFSTPIDIVVTMDGVDADDVADQAHPIAQAYLMTLGTQTGDSRITSVEADLDGTGAYDVEEVDD